MHSLGDMQERKNKRLALLLICTIAVTVMSSFWINRRSTESVDPSTFRIEDLSIVDSVALVAPGRNVSLRFDGTKWMVNESYRADGQMIEVFFATLEQIVPRRPVSENMRDSVEKLLKESGTKVELFANGEKKGEFYAGGNERKSEAWFVSPQKGPFVVVIPGYRVYASGVFELDEGGWRDKQVFRFNQRNFRSLALDFVREPSNSFVINYEDQLFEIPGLPEADTAKVFNYLDAASLLKAESIVRPGELQWVDSLLSQPPSFTIGVTDISGRTSRLRIYSPLAGKRQVLGVMGDEPALFNKSDIVKLAKKRSYFVISR
jgi:hypothetical protein